MCIVWHFLYHFFLKAPNQIDVTVPKHLCTFVTSTRKHDHVTYRSVYWLHQRVLDTMNEGEALQIVLKYSLKGYFEAVIICYNKFKSSSTTLHFLLNYLETVPILLLRDSFQQYFPFSVPVNCVEIVRSLPLSRIRPNLRVHPPINMNDILPYPKIKQKQLPSICALICWIKWASLEKFTTYIMIFIR